MSEDPKKSAIAEDLSSTGEDTLGSSISLSLYESSVRIRVKSKPPTIEGTELKIPVQDGRNEEKKWWLKRPETRLGLSPRGKHPGAAMDHHKPSPSPDVSSSMKEFLEKEKFCKVLPKNDGETAHRDKDDTLCDILASSAFDKYPSDFENATDEDIGSFLEEMSKIAGALSPNSAPERTKSGEDSSKNPTEEEKSVEELLEEAEKLVRENVGLSKSASRSDTLVPDDLNPTRDASRARRLEEDIFHQIEQEVHRESEKNRKSPKNEKKPRETSPGYEILYENVNTLEPPKLSSLESQKKRFDDHKVEVSSSSDLDDPIDRHSKSEDPKDPKETDKDKENLQKEITDVDKDFFDDLLRRSKEKMEGGLSGSSSFGQEDFSHFLRILQGQDRTDHDSKITTNKSPLRIPKTDNIIFPEREITEILEKELAREKDAKIVETNTQEFCESDSSVASTERGSKQRERESSQTRSSSKLTERPPLSRNSSEDDSRRSNKSKTEDAKKVVNSKNELYTVGLTPRLELFADAIPKLIAEKSENDREEKKQQDEDPKIVKTPKEKPVVNETIETANKTSEKATKNSENLSELVKKDRQLGTSRSYDQLPAPAKKLRSSLDDVRPARSSDHRRPSYPVKSTIPSKATKNSQKFPATRPPSNIKLKPNATKLNIFPKPEVNRYPLGGGDSRRNLSKDDYEILHREEKRKNSLLKSQIESEASLYKQQIQSMRTSFETELFALKKQNIILKAKIDELTLNERRSEIPTKIPITSSTRVSLLEKELEKQEGMINAYETENKRLILELKRIQEEAKITEAKKNTKVDVNETQRLNKLNDVIKDLKEEKLKMNIEITDLRQKNNEGLLKIEDVMQQNSLLKEELNMFKDQLRSKNEFINDRLQSMTTAEMESRKKTEDLRIELSSKTEQLKCIKMEYEKLREAVLPLEKELLELRVKDENLTKKLQISKSHVEREKEMTMKLKDQVILDNKRILDLNRQVREMERILKRKNPDSVSALILSANSDHQRINLEKVKLLEERIASLEGEIKAKELISQEKLTELQKRFAEMKEKYVVQVMELEEKLIEATMKEAKICNDAFTQTATKTVENKSVEAGSQKKDERERSSSLQIEKDDKKAVKIGLKSQNPKEDAHLIATIRGLKLELVNKEKSFAKINKEFQELQKTNKRLQKEREKLLNDRRNFKGGEGIERNGKTVGIQGVKGNEANDQNSNVYHNGHVSNGNGQLSGSVQRLYDPLQYSENGESAVVRKLTNENEILKEELGKINKDFMTLKNKRLYDLNLLQEEHEREIAALVKEYSVKFGDSKVVKLQGQINTQVTIITHLKQQIEKLRDYKEQVIVLKVEREHLENKVKILNEKVKYLSTPGTEQLQLLQDKITILQQRHESREMTLQSLVRDLLRNRTQCRDCKGEKGKNNKQLCYFRQELDHILGMLQEISNV